MQSQHRRSLYSSLVLLTAASAGMALLAGCSGFQGVAFPDATPVPTASTVGAVSGNVYGGHAPLVGAHVYLVQPGTTGYGSQVTSVLTSSAYNANYPLYTNGSFPNTGSVPDQFVPAGFQGVLTNSAGEFYISGDYTCTANQPVILIAYGGSPSYAGAGPNTFPISSIQVSNLAGQTATAGTATYTFTIPAASQPELFYPGESITFAGTSLTTGSGAPGGFNGFFNGQALTVASAGLTTAGFQITFNGDFGGYPTAGSAVFPAQTTAQSGATVTASPAFNPAAVNMSVLGNCPSAQPLTAVTIAGTASPYMVTVTGANTLSPGNAVTFAGLTGAAAALNGTKGQVQSSGLSATGFKVSLTTGTTQTAGTYTSSTGTFFAGFNNISYIYTNEISTTATAYAFAGFANTTAAALTGYDEFHIGSSGTTQALQASANAAITAGNLYDIQGSNTAAGNPDGDVHIARTTTPSGMGTVSTTLINTIGNILAACVDSANTYRLDVNPITGTQSPQCQVLGQYVQDNGYYDTTSTTDQSANIAQAAFSLARFPQGNGTRSNGTVTAGTAATAASFMSSLIALPAGNVPFTPYSGGSGNTPAGSTTAVNDFAVNIEWANTTANGGTTASLSHISIDAAGNVWGASPLGTNGSLYEYTPAGVITAYTGTASLANNPGVAIDASTGKVWMPGAAGIYKFTPGTAAGTQVGGGNSTLASEVEVDAAVNQYFVGNGAITGTGTVAGSFIGKQSATGTAAGGNFPIYGNPLATANTAGACANYAAFLTLDGANNLWVTDAGQGFNANTYVCRFDVNGNLAWSLLLPTNLAGQSGGFSIPHTIAVDKGGNAYFAEKDQNLLYRVTAGTTTTNGGFTTAGGSLQAPRGLAIDGANTVWVTNTGDNGSTTGAKAPVGLVQFSTAATPVQLTPNFITGGVVPIASATASTGIDLVTNAIDPSGNIWATGTSINAGVSTTYLFEFIGTGTPTVTPLAAAKIGGTTGTKP